MKVGGSLGSLGCGPVPGFQGILPWKKIRNFHTQGCHDRASDRMW